MSAQPSSSLTFIEARELARRAGETDWKKYVPENCHDCLSDRFLEAEGCWFFFRNPAIIVPEEDPWIRAYSAFAISKLGDVRSILDFSAEPEKLADYLDLMSAHFIHREQGGPKPPLPDWIR